MRFLFGLLLMLAPTVVGAQEPELPPIVSDGLVELVASGPDAGLAVWLEHWTSEADRGQGEQLLSGFQRIWGSVGPASDYEVVAVCRLGSHVQYVYAVLVHAAQPVYVSVGAYMSPKGWRVTKVNADTDMTEVIPEAIRVGASTC